MRIPTEIVPAPWPKRSEVAQLPHLTSRRHPAAGEENGFTSIPQSVYWAIVTMTTVGYGDLVPQTLPGKTLASMVMVLGYSIIAVPTGIITAEIVENAVVGRISTRCCPECTSEGHVLKARFCKDCGAPFD